MNATLRMIRWDMLLQIRSHLYLATAMATLSLCLVGALLHPLDISEKLLALLLFADPAVIGLTLTGAFVLMERGNNTLLALAVSPLRGSTYVFAKIATFSGLGILSGIAVAIAASDGNLRFAIMLASLSLTNAAAVLFGFALVTRANSVNSFLVHMSVALLIMVVPFIPYLDETSNNALLMLALIPSYSMLVLLEAGFAEASISLAQYLLNCSYVMVWIIIGWFWAVREYQNHIRLGGA